MLNRVTLIGNLGRDPEIKDIGPDSKVARLSVATTETYTNKEGNKQDQTEWHTVILWNRLAEVAQMYYKKGATILVEGKLTHRSYEKDGQTRYITEVRGNFCRKLKDPSGNGPYTPMPESDHSSSNANRSDKPAPAPVPVVADVADEDLPF